MQHGLSRTSACSGLYFWRESSVAEEALGRAVCAVPGCDRSALGVAADAALRPKIVAILKAGFGPVAFPIYWAARLMGKPLGTCMIWW